jgi:penicillin-binding protein 2
MSPKLTLKDPNHEFRVVRRRILAAAGLMLVALLVLLGRVFHLQVVMHDHFTTLSQHNRVKIVPIPPMRGLIFSRDGVLLADNRPSFSLEIVPERVEDIDAVIAELRRIILIDDSDVARFKEQIRKKRRFESVPLRFNLSEEEVARISVRRHRFPGVEVVARLNRYYPLGPNLAHTIGYVGMIDEADMESLDKSNYAGTTHIGKLGVEKAYESLLHGRVGYQQVEVNAQGRVIRVLSRTPPVPGKNLYLSLHVGLQNLAVQALEGRRGAIVALDPRDGAVLALVSSPGYDPNLFVNGIDAKTYRGLLSSKDTPLLNRALQGKYPPGSTIKPFLALTALEHGVRTPGETTWCPGWYSLKGSSHRYRDWKKGGHGHVNMHEAVAQSCDVYFYALAQDLGIDNLSKALSGFGFGGPTGVDIGGESSGVVPSPQWKRGAMGQPWYPGETLILGIGQGFMLATPMQLATATMVLANHGRVLKPQVLAEARDPVTGEVVMRTSPAERREISVRDRAYWEAVVASMNAVVQGPTGTARRSGDKAGYRFAGKTGTAQVFGIAQDGKYDANSIPEELRDHALFIAFAPLEDPRIALAVIVENGGGGSSTAAPIARTLLDYYLGTPESDQRVAAATAAR